MRGKLLFLWHFRVEVGDRLDDGGYLLSAMSTTIFDDF